MFANFGSESVATLRFTTVVDDAGGISVRACFLRLGRADDTHIQTDREICVAVSLSTGELCREGYMSNWGATEEHPDSKVRFFGVKIPAFSKCVVTVLDLHKKIPFARCVGWDVTVDVDENVQVMEWNGGPNDVKFSEATQGPCFSDLKWEQLQLVDRMEIFSGENHVRFVKRALGPARQWQPASWRHGACREGSKACLSCKERRSAIRDRDGDVT